MRRLVPALISFALLTPAAHALPGDPPSEPVAPADAASVPADPDGIGVAFTCPPFRPLATAPYQAGSEAYFASFSDSPVVDATGRLTTEFGSIKAVGGDPCSATFTTRTGAESSGDAPEIVGGTVYWQAYRICGDCAGGTESSAVRSFTVVPRAPSVKLTVPARAYAGYGAVYSADLDPERSGVRSLLLERKAGSRWKRVATQSASVRTTLLIGKLPRGKQTVRLRATVGATSFVVATRTLTVRPDRKRTTSARDDGRLRGRDVAVRVTGGGQRVARFTAVVPATCVTPDPGGGAPIETARTLNVALRGLRIAPDGSVAAAADGAVLTGRVHGRRFTGAVSVQAGNCAGSRKVKAG